MGWGSKPWPPYMAPTELSCLGLALCWITWGQPSPQDPFSHVTQWGGPAPGGYLRDPWLGAGTGIPHLTGWRRQVLVKLILCLSVTHTHTHTLFKRLRLFWCKNAETQAQEGAPERPWKRLPCVDFRGVSIKINFKNLIFYQLLDVCLSHGSVTTDKAVCGQHQGVQGVAGGLAVASQVWFEFWPCHLSAI